MLKARVPQPPRCGAKNEGLSGSRVAFSLVSLFWLSKRKKLASRAKATSYLFNRARDCYRFSFAAYFSLAHSMAAQQVNHREYGVLYLAYLYLTWAQVF